MNATNATGRNVSKTPSRKPAVVSVSPAVIAEAQEVVTEAPVAETLVPCIVCGNRVPMSTCMTLPPDFSNTDNREPRYFCKGDCGGLKGKLAKQTHKMNAAASEKAQAKANKPQKVAKPTVVPKGKAIIVLNADHKKSGYRKIIMDTIMACKTTDELLAATYTQGTLRKLPTVDIQWAIDNKIIAIAE